MHAPAAIAVIRAPHLIFEYVNTNFHELVGLHRALEGQPVREAFPDLEEHIIATLNEVIRSCERFVGKEFPILLDWNNTGEMSTRYFNFTYEPLLEDGVCTRVMVVCFEVTDMVLEKQRVEQMARHAELANRAKSRFLAGMSHEIRSPLGVILGFADLALDADASASDMKKYLCVIKRNGEELARIIGNILDISKVEAEKIDLESSQFALSAFLNEVVGSMRVRAREKNIRLVLKTHMPVPHFITTDATRLRQILVNVLSNAIKFTKQGQVTLECRWASSDRDGAPAELEFTVSDTGIGMTEAQQAHLFQPFAQADNTVHRRFGGTGLGLLLSKQLAQLMGGDLRLLSSAPDRGSTFMLQIVAGPVSLSDDSKAKFQKNPTATTEPSMSGQLKDVRVLVVEDSVDNQVLVTRFLRAAGADVDIAQNGADGILKAQQKTYNVILMDIQMPILDGLTATSQLREMGYKKPIIALTAHAMREEREMAAQNGFDEYLIKPLTRKNLIENIRKFCQ